MEEVTQLQVDVGVLKTQVASITTLCDKMDKVIERLMENQERIANEIYDDMTREQEDNTQNTRLTSIETVNNNQNTSISIIQGVDNGQNTYISNVEQYAQAAYAKANTAASIADILALSIALG